MSPLKAMLITLSGVLLCIAGALAVLVSGLDPLVGGIGLLVCGAGGSAIWYAGRFREKSDPGGDAAPGARSKPPEIDPNAKKSKWEPPKGKY